MRFLIACSVVQVPLNGIEFGTSMNCENEQVIGGQDKADGEGEPIFTCFLRGGYDEATHEEAKKWRDFQDCIKINISSHLTPKEKDRRKAIIILNNTCIKKEAPSHLAPEDVDRRKGIQIKQYQY